MQQEMYKNISAAGVLGTTNIALRRTFRDRQMSMDAFNKLQKGKFDPYYPSDDIQDKIRENARKIGDANPFIEARPILRDIRRDLSRLNLFEAFDLLLGDYLFEDLGFAPLGLGTQTAIPTPGINQELVTQGTTGGTGTQAILPSGLTATEEAFLSNEEKAMRLRQRGQA